MDSLFELGLSLGAMNRTDSACSAFRELLINFPSAPAQMTQRARDEMLRLQCG
jgi:TolA-binding protein